MRSQTMGRQELLQWINEFTECDYPKIELLSDGIAYCQVIDSIHIGSINLIKLNYNARYPEDYCRNLKILDDAFTKLRIEKVLAIDQLAKGKFQDNMNFLQWLFNYTSKNAPFALRSYRGYQKRQEGFEKQSHGKFSQMSAHLIPNTEFLRFKHNQHESIPTEEVKVQQEYSSINQISTIGSQVNRRLQFVDDMMKDLEGDLKNKMEYNWKLIYALDDMVYQRDVLFGILQKIDNTVTQCSEKSAQSEKILQIIKDQPEDFQFTK